LQHILVEKKILKNMIFKKIIFNITNFLLTSDKKLEI